MSDKSLEINKSRKTVGLDMESAIQVIAKRHLAEAVKQRENLLTAVNTSV